MTFEELAKVNVNEHIEKKGNLSYLSWAWAVDYMTRLDPESSWSYREWDSRPYLMFPDETCMVYCSVTFGGKEKTAHLPVMDHRNKPIAKPDAFAINTAMQRALVKAIALHGLGLYIYAGEDVPKDEADAAREREAEAKGKNGNGARLPSGSITPTAGAKANLSPEQQEKVSEIVNSCMYFLKREPPSVPDAVAVADEAEMDADETVFFWTHFDSKQRAAMKLEAKARRERALKREEATQA